MSTTGKNTLSIRKKDVASQKNLSLGFKKLVFAHKAGIGETTVDLTALTTPTEMSSLGFTNPTAADLAAAQLKLYQDNLILTSSARPFLIKDLSYTIRNNTSIQLEFETLEDEIIVGYIDHVPKTGLSVVDARPIIATGTLAAGTTDINVGQPFEAGKYPTEQAGAVLVYIDGVLQARNSGNQASPQDGNYYEVNAGGLSQLVRMNQSDLSDRSYIVISNGLIAEKPEGSQLAEIEKAQGQIDALIPTVAQLAGVPETDFQAAPNNQDLKQFGDRVLQNEQDIEALQNVTVEAISVSGTTPSSPASVTTTASQLIFNAAAAFSKNTLPGYNPASGQLTASKEGWYRYSVNLVIDQAAASAHLFLNPRINGVVKDTIIGELSATATRTATINSGLIYLEQGDIFDFLVGKSSGTGTWVGGTASFSIEYIGL